MDRSEIEEVLESCELFKGLGRRELRQIARLCLTESYKAGDAIFRQGDFGEKIYIIAKGQVLLERATDLGTRTGSALIGMLGKGRALGCWSTLLDEAHHLMSSAVCSKPTRLVVMKGPDLRKVMMSHAAIGFCILERLCFLLRDRIQGAYGALERV